MIQKLIKLLIAIFTKKYAVPPTVVTPPKEPIIVPPEPQIAPVEEVKPEVLLWDTPERARHSARVVMDTFGLTKKDKDLLCAVLMAESGFKNNATCKNKNAKGEVTSTDWGVAQINDFWHCGKGRTFPSAKYVVDHPEEAVAFMVKMHKAKKLNLWVAFNNGSYKKYL
jgi:hypothetical protein